MKKTLIALMALAGMALASEVEPYAVFNVISNDAHNSNGTPGSITITQNGTALQGGSFWAHGGLTFNQNANSFTTNGEGNLQYMNNGSADGIVLGNMSYAFDASWNHTENSLSYLTSVGQDPGYGQVYGFRIGINAQNKWTIDTEGYSALTLNVQTDAGISGSGYYCISSEMTAAGDYTLSVYENGNLIVQGTGKPTFGNPQNFKLSFGGAFGIDGTNMVGTFSNVALYNQIIPEPATATLSLLALAGLAARRRRR